MTAPTADLLAVLDVARNNGSVDQAITRAGKHALIDAEQHGLIRVVHDHAGVVGAHWAANQADYVEQRNTMHLQLTAVGHDHLRSE